MTNEDTGGSGIPDDFPLNVDWEKMEYAVNNGGSTEGAPDTNIPEHILLSEDMVLQRMLWDTAPHELYEDVAAYLRMPPSSEEVLEKEHMDSHHRTLRVLIVAPPVDMLARLAAKTIMGTMTVMNGEAESTPYDGEEFTDAVERLEPVLFNVSLSVIGLLVEWGLLHTPHIIGGSMEDIAEIGRRMMEAAQAANEEDEDGQPE